MMIRRALCLLLACQLLLVQGLLCRSCPASGAQQGHAADRPHIHARSLIPAPSAELELKRCPCCQRRPDRGAQPPASTMTNGARSGAGDTDDAVYLPASLVAEKAHRNQPRPADLLSGPAIFVAGLWVGGLLERRPEPALPPSPCPARLAPIYLLTLALLI
jgi:hypothetical protein